jgi:hypothetical protein
MTLTGMSTSNERMNMWLTLNEILRKLIASFTSRMIPVADPAIPKTDRVTIPAPPSLPLTATTYSIVPQSSLTKRPELVPVVHYGAMVQLVSAFAKASKNQVQKHNKNK